MSVDNWNEDSILSRAGYTADGSQFAARRVMHIDYAINGRMENAIEVMQHLKWLIEDRGHRYPHARMIWSDDLQYVCRRINDGLPGDASALYKPAYHRTRPTSRFDQKKS